MTGNKQIHAYVQDKAISVCNELCLYLAPIFSLKTLAMTATQMQACWSDDDELGSTSFCGSIGQWVLLNGLIRMCTTRVLPDNGNAEYSRSNNDDPYIDKTDRSKGTKHLRYYFLLQLTGGRWTKMKRVSPKHCVIEETRNLLA